MTDFIVLHQVKCLINGDDSYHKILVKIKDIYYVTDDGHNSLVYLKHKTPFHPLTCRECPEDIIKILQEKGITLHQP